LPPSAFLNSEGGNLVHNTYISEDESAVESGNWNADTWYKVVWSVADGYQTYRLFDDATGTLIYERTRVIDGNDVADRKWYFVLAQQHHSVDYDQDRHEAEAGIACTAGFSLDDVALWTLDKNQVWSQPRYDSSTVSGETITLTFDQPLLATGADYKVVNNSTGREEEGVTFSSVQELDDTLKIEKLALIGSGNISETSISNAQEMIAKARQV